MAVRRSKQVSRFRPGGFNGRSFLMLELNSTLERTQAGGGAMVLLTGAAGIGKTAVAEQLGRIALRQKMAVLWGSCVDGHGQPPYWPLRQILRQLVAVHGWPKLAQLAGEDAALLTALLPERGEFVGTDRIHLFETLTRLLVTVAAEQPLLIVVDDAHWADPASLPYLDFLGTRVAAAPVMVILTSEHAAPGAAARIELEPLTAWETATTLSSAIEAWPEPEFVAKVVRRGGGLPLFTVEVGRGLGPAEQPTGAVLVPASLTKQLERRVDALGERNADILSEAAVLGTDFDAREVAKVSGRRLDHVRAALAESSRAVLIAEKPNNPYGFGFMHPLIRAQAYARLSTQDRMALHGQAGQALAENWFDHAGESASWIAEHFFLSPSPKRAAEYARRAGDYAATVLAQKNAAIHHARADGLT